MELPGLIGVADMLRQIGQGIGDASNAIAERSPSNLNALAIKTVDATIDFEFSGFSSDKVVGLAMRPNLIGLGSSSSQVSQTNKCHIVLHIVAVDAPKPAPTGKPGSAGDTSSGSTPGGGNPNSHGPAGPQDPDLRQRLQDIVTAARHALDQAHLPAAEAAAIAKELDAVNADINGGRLKDAEALLGLFIARHLKGLRLPHA